MGCWRGYLSGARCRLAYDPADATSILAISNTEVAAAGSEMDTYRRWALSVAGPMAWNSLPDFIRDPTSSADCFRRLLKTYLFDKEGFKPGMKE